MYTPVPGIYEQLLENEIATVSFAEVDAITGLFESKTTHLRVVDQETHNETLQQARNVRALLDQPHKLTDRQLLIALAALRYFVRDEDHADGHQDDALVIQAAVNQLQEPLQELQA